PELAGMDNERLEFLGDAVLDFLAGAYLFAHYPEMQEGDLTSLRAALVRTETLADFAAGLELGEHLRLGRGEERSGGRERPVILCGAFEALVGALYLDQGLPAARELFEHLAAPRLSSILRENADRDPKSQLQELTQQLLQLTPAYLLVEESGPDHAKEFTVEVWVGELPYGRGSGSSKQKATLQAALAALSHPTLLAALSRAEADPMPQEKHV
ncbi:MAG: ribonuclease III, partial [Chloroflexi bacterium]|nr:ribonuclease III [Chloroflexota bacterium]